MLFTCKIVAKYMRNMYYTHLKKWNQQMEQSNLQRITIDCAKELNLRERLKLSAKRNKRSLNKQVEFALEEFLRFDEMSEQERFAIEKLKWELLEGRKQAQSFF